MTQLARALDIAGLSDAGLMRSHNEDAIDHDAAHGLVVLADGMGGYNAGEVASGIATTLLSQGIRGALEVMAPHLPEPMSQKPAAHRILRLEIERANLAIFQTAQSQPQCAGMGTTLITGLFYDNRLTVAHVGDSRLYRLRQGRMQVLTRDHSLLQEQLDSGLITADEARVSQNRNLVTRAVGIDPQLEPELNDFEVAVGDLYLFCSDGLNDMVDDGQIEAALQAAHTPLPELAEQLIRMANDSGGRDNISVILVRIERQFAAQRSLWRRLLGR